MNTIHSEASAGSVASVHQGQAALRAARLGEELPVFCERCGYSLHGLPQVRCERCDVLQFQCPECGHHQAINTLRPAFQRILGRVRGFFLGLSVLIKLNYFGWLLFAWFTAGYAFSYQHQWLQSTPTGAMNFQYVPYEPYPGDLIGVFILAMAFGMVGRMLVLRWRRHWAVGLILGGLTGLAMVLGAWFRVWERSENIHVPVGEGVYLLASNALAGVMIGALVVWWVWIACVYILLPRRAAEGLIDWQRGLSSPRVSQLARE